MNSQIYPGKDGPPICLTVAGSDSGGGAGIQADIKTFSALGCYGASAITALTAQNTLGVSAIHAPLPDFVSAQIDAVLSDIGADALKTGMLFNPQVIHAVAESFRNHDVSGKLVVDPVMVAASGARLLAEDAIEAIIEELLPQALVLTPNIPETMELTGMAVHNEKDAIDAGMRLLEMGPEWVVIKGGHASGPESVDLLIGSDKRVERLVGPRFDTQSTHGTGCSFAAAICANLAHGMDLPLAVRKAKKWLSDAISNAYRIGAGAGPVHHFHNLWKSDRNNEPE